MIVVAKYPVLHVNAFAHIAAHILAAEPGFAVADQPLPGTRYAIGWGDKMEGCPGSVMESGFFLDAAHLDTRGMYSRSSLNTDDGFRAVLDGPPRALPELESKYSQTNVQVSWEGVVLACQTPNDRSIRDQGGPQAYWAFLEGACRYYGKHLFLKLHPWNNGEDKERTERLALAYGCTAAKCDHSAIARCAFVLSYNSTFIVDCLVRSIPVVAFVESAFSRYVDFSQGKYRPWVTTYSQRHGRRLLQFLAYNYCFNHTMTKEKTLRMFEHFSMSKDPFPMTDEFCYALNPSDPAARGRKHAP